VSENALVELWAPRLKKCPRGYSMLSDRGFANTARFYPNLNHQKTPKFLSGWKQFSAAEVSADRTIWKGLQSIHSPKELSLHSSMPL